MNLQNIAYSACYGSGYGIDQKPCPCGCRPAPAIAPPVAMGSMDTSEIDSLLAELSAAAVHDYRSGKPEKYLAVTVKVINFIDARGAQQREAGLIEGKTHSWMAAVTAEKDCHRTIVRAEKAEARVAELEAALK